MPSASIVKAVSVEEGAGLIILRLLTESVPEFIGLPTNMGVPDFPI